jgi:hypothetical protein
MMRLRARGEAGGARAAKKFTSEGYSSHKRVGPPHEQPPMIAHAVQAGDT